MPALETLVTSVSTFLVASSAIALQWFFPVAVAPAPVTAVNTVSYATTTEIVVVKPPVAANFVSNQVQTNDDYVMDQLLELSKRQESFEQTSLRQATDMLHIIRGVIALQTKSPLYSSGVSEALFKAQIYKLMDNTNESIRDLRAEIATDSSFSGLLTSNLTLDGYYISGDGDDEGIYISAAGDVGVGTTTGASMLTVAGELGLYGALRDSSASVGSSGMILQSTGSGVTWVATSTLGLVGGSSATGSVMSVGLTAPVGFTVSGSPVTTTGTLGFSYAAGYESLLSASSTNWNSFYTTPSARIVAGSGLGWTGNTLALDTSGDWSGTFGGQSGSYYLSRSNQTGTQATSTITGVFGLTQGGTGLSSVTQNQLLIGGAGNTWSQVATSSLGLSLADSTGNLSFSRLTDFGGTNNILYTSAKNTLATSSVFTFDGTTFTAPTLSISGNSTLLGTTTIGTTTARTAMLTVAGGISSPYIGTDNEVFGSGASLSGSFGSGNTLLGVNAQITSGVSGRSTVIGANASSSANSGWVTVIGADSRISSGGSSVLIGQGSTLSGGSSVVIGNTTTVTKPYVVTVGFGNGSTASNTIVIGSGMSASVSGDIVMGDRYVASNTPRVRLVGATTLYQGRDLLNIDTNWLDSTDATRRSQVVFNTFDYGGTREFLRAETTGTGINTAFFGNSVSIGTTSTSSLFSVLGTSTFMGGNVGIGTSSPSSKLTVAGDGYFGGNLTATGTFSVSGISSFSSSVGIGTTTPSAQLTTTGTVRFANFGAGTLQTDADGNLSVSSDERLKDIAGFYEAGLTEVLGLNPILFKWNATSGLEQNSVYAGFSAQNVKEFLPDAVGEDKRGFFTLSDRSILAAVVTAIQDIWEKVLSVESDVAGQSDRIDLLEQENQELKERLDALEGVENQGGNTDEEEEIIIEESPSDSASSDEDIESPVEETTSDEEVPAEEELDPEPEPDASTPEEPSEEVTTP